MQRPSGTSARPSVARESAVARLLAGCPGARDLRGPAALHHAVLVSRESRARQSRPHLELHRRPRLRPPGNLRRPRVAARERRSPDDASRSEPRRALEGLRRARELHRRPTERHHRHLPAHRSPRRQMEDQPEPLGRRSGQRRRRPARSRHRRERRDGQDDGQGALMLLVSA